jgi:nitrite reductase (NADH) large subunit
MAETARAKHRFDAEPRPGSDPPTGADADAREATGPRPTPLARKKARARGDADTSSTGRLIIVGNGMVSQRLCEQLLRGHEQGGGQLPELVVFGEESRPAYDRVHLGEVLRGRPADSLLLAPPSWYLSRGIRLHLGDPVELVDPPSRTVVSRRGHELRYDRLVLATGAAPASLPVIADPHDLLYLRTVEDALQLQRQQARARTAVVVGGGLLGVETAATLREAGLEVTIIEVSDRLMRRQLDPATAEVLRASLERRGVTVVTGRGLSTVVRVDAGDGVRKRLILGGGLELSADLVVVATGVRARDQLGGPGLRRHPQGGYLVDELLRTSDPRIHAIGDCAVAGGAATGHVLPGYRMAEALAETLLGRPRAFVAPPPSLRLKLPGAPLLLAGACPADGWTTSASDAGEGRHRALALADGRVVAAAALGAWPEWNRLEQAVEAREPLTGKQLRRFARGGAMWPRARAPEPVAESGPRPDEILCSCNLVSLGTVRAAIGAGCRTVSEVTCRTRAGGGCGSCAPVVQAMLASAETAPVRRGFRTVAAAGALALAAIGTLLAAASPAVRAALVPARWDFLWREPGPQQATGFALVGLFLVALLLPLRNRLGARVPGSGNLWRVVHVLVGVLLVLALAVHGSARAGQGLNLAVSVATAALVVAGGAAALGWRAAPPQRRAVRGWLRPLHRLLLWPALGLIAAHVLAVYYF